MQHLYAEGNGHAYMALTTYEQIGLTEEDINEQVYYILSHIEAQLNFHIDNLIGMKLLATLVLEVIDTESIHKGHTDALLGKLTKLETGLSFTVPQFFGASEKAKLSTGVGDLVERIMGHCQV